jgi:hypothetical protein
MMLPLNLNLQLNATIALWANDSSLKNITQEYSKILLNKKGKAEKGRSWMFFLWEGEAPRTCC